MSRIRIPLAQPQPLRLPLFYRVKRQSQNRFYAEFVPKAPINFKKPVTRIFDETSKPRPYMRTERDLPPVKKRWPMLIAMSTFTIASWAAFYAFHINKEKLSTSVVRQLLYTISHDKELAAVLGDNVNIQPRWWVNGRGWVNGAISTLQGKVDVSFRIEGDKGAGTLYFSSVRKAKGEPFQILRFRVRADDGTVVNIKP